MSFGPLGLVLPRCRFRRGDSGIKAPGHEKRNHRAIAVRCIESTDSSAMDELRFRDNHKSGRFGREGERERNRSRLVGRLQVVGLVRDHAETT